MSELILINISGRDRKGLNSKFSSLLANYDVNILDILIPEPGAFNILVRGYVNCERLLL